MEGCFVREAQGSLYHLVGALVVANSHLGVDQSFYVGNRKMLRRKLAGTGWRYRTAPVIHIQYGIAPRPNKLGFGLSSVQ
jgi:hypothetical protein